MRTFNERVNKRFSETLPVAVSYLDGRRIRWATNISYGGMQLRRGIEDVMEGDAVDVQFDLPEELGAIYCVAEVIYDRDGFLGLQFLDLSIQQQYALDRYIAKRVEQRWFL